MLGVKTMINVDKINDINVLLEYRAKLLNQEVKTTKPKNLFNVEVTLPNGKEHLNKTLEFIKPFSVDHSKHFNRIQNISESIYSASLSKIASQAGSELNITIEKPEETKHYEKIIHYHKSNSKDAA